MKTYTVRCEWDSTGWWVVTVLELAGAVSRRDGSIRCQVTWPKWSN